MPVLVEAVEIFPGTSGAVYLYTGSLQSPMPLSFTALILNLCSEFGASSEYK